MARRSRRIGSRPAFHYLAEDDEGEHSFGGLNHLLSRHAGGAKWTWKKVTVVVDSRAAENVMLRGIFPEIGLRQTERSKDGKGFKGPGGENIKNFGQQVMSVRTPEGFVHKSTWQVADVRRPLVSASHIIPARNYLFIEFAAYLMNRCDIGIDEKTPLQRLHGRRDNTPILEFGERILYMSAKPARREKWEPRSHPRVFVGMLNSSSDAVVVTEQGQMGRWQNTRDAGHSVVPRWQ